MAGDGKVWEEVRDLLEEEEVGVELVWEDEEGLRWGGDEVGYLVGEHWGG